MHLIQSDTIQSSSKFDVDFLETLVYEWIRRNKFSKQFRLTNTIIKSIALQFRTILKLKSFSANKEWIHNFRITYDLKDVFTSQKLDIGYKDNKSTVPMDIFNELKPKWESLDPTLSPNRFDEAEEKVEEFFDIEDELPVCTIFGRKSLENVANIISSDQNSKEKTFQPMIVCTDPKNPNLNTIQRATTQSEKVVKSTNLQDMDKNKDSDSERSTDNVLSTSKPSEYMDRYLQEMVLGSECDRNKGPSSQSSPKTNCDAQLLRVRKLEDEKIITKTAVGIVEVPPDLQKSKNMDFLDSTKDPSENRKKPNLKRKAQKKSCELSKGMNSETRNVDQTSIIKQTSLDPVLSSVESTPPSLQTISSNQIPIIMQQTTNTLITNSPSETALATQPSVVNPEGITFALQLPAPNQNQLTMPFITSVPTNVLAYQFGQPTTLQPIVLHFNSPVAGSDVINLAQIPVMSQTSFIPTIDLTQQATTTNFTNLIQNQLIQPTETLVQQFSTIQNQTSALEVTESNSSLTSAVVMDSASNLDTSFKIKLPESIKIQTITPKITCSTSESNEVKNSVPFGQTKTLPKALKPKPKPATITSIQLPVSPEIPTVLNSPTPNSSLIAVTPSTVTRIELPIITSPSSNLSLATPSACSSSFIPAKISQINTLPIQTPTTSKSNQNISKPLAIGSQSSLKDQNASKNSGTRFAQRAPLRTQNEVIKCIKLMEEFAMMNENFRLIGFLERLEKQIYTPN